RPLFELDAIRGQIAELREKLSSQPSFLVKLQATHDPIGLLSLLYEAALRNRGAFRIDLLDGYYLSPDRKSLLLIAKPKRPPQDVDFSHRLHHLVEEARGQAVEKVRSGLEAGEPDPLEKMEVEY